jgi:hypothetical protein
MAEPKLLDRAGCFALAEATGDHPSRTIVGHALRTGRCRAAIAGDLPGFSAAAVNSEFLPGELFGFGTDMRALVGLLDHVGPWHCVLVDAAHAASVADLATRATGRSAQLWEDLHYVLGAPPNLIHHRDVRRLKADEADLLVAAVDGAGVDGQRWYAERALAEGIVAAGIIDGRVVSTAICYAQTPLHGDIAVNTSAAYRGQGLAAAAAGIVATELIHTGKRPVWSTRQDNLASQRVAVKLGFRQVETLVYVVRGDLAAATA